MKEYPIDPDRVHLTGLSMGGNGTWTVAATHGDRFATATMVCGFGPIEMASQNAKLPMQIFCGDKDMDFILKSTREIEAELKKMNAPMTMTWYPGIGHNSWDSAYSTDALYDWMAKHSRGSK
jgi:predicted peptidase